MKHSTTRVLLPVVSLAVVLTLAFVACDAVDRSNAAPEAVARLDDGELVTLAEDDRAEALLRGGLSQMRPDVRLASLEATPKVEQLGAGYFLVGRGTDEEGRCVTVAVSLDQDEGGLLGRLDSDGSLRGPPGGHTCTGQNCSRCSLALDGGGVYCACTRDGGGPGESWCDHTCSGDSC